MELNQSLRLYLKVQLHHWTTDDDGDGWGGDTLLCVCVCVRIYSGTDEERLLHQ